MFLKEVYVAIDFLFSPLYPRGMYILFASFYTFPFSLKNVSWWSFASVHASFMTCLAFHCAPVVWFVWPVPCEQTRGVPTLAVSHTVAVNDPAQATERIYTVHLSNGLPPGSLLVPVSWASPVSWRMFTCPRLIGQRADPCSIISYFSWVSLTF